MSDVAIIGAGPAGLVAAKYLKQYGMVPTLFEQGNAAGGQWCSGAPYSGVWPGMCTNTSRLMTMFSDLAHDHDAASYLSQEQMYEYLQRYAQSFDLIDCLRLRTKVTALERDSENAVWRLSYRTEDGETQTVSFSRVVVASGRYCKPRMPDIAGIEEFAGAVSHSFEYRGPDAFRGMRVVVAGGSISALEIASELAVQGTARLISSQRKQRYVLSKLIAGVPVEHLAFTRFGALAAEALPPEVVGDALKRFVVESSGKPQTFGAMAPAEDVFQAGITQNQCFLPLIAEGRIVPKPWISKIAGHTVEFSDGTSEEADALVYGTGFDVHLPFLAPETRELLDIDGEHIDLYAHTLHPELPGLAFLGLFDIVGPAFPVLELQARWLAYQWAGVRAAPSADELSAGIQAYRATRHLPATIPMHMLAMLFSRLAGVDPDIEKYPELARALLFGPLSPDSFRLCGPDSLPDAAAGVARSAAMFGAVPDPSLTDEQRAQLGMLAAALGDPKLAALA